jgi:hypothetical protein
MEFVVWKQSDWIENKLENNALHLVGDCLTSIATCQQADYWVLRYPLRFVNAGWSSDRKDVASDLISESHKGRRRDGRD